MNIQEAIGHVLQGRDLDRDAMQAVMRELMTGVASPAQIGGFLVGLRAKGETVTEIAAAAEVMRSLADRVTVDGDPVDIVGTGGDVAGTFNVSTASSIVAAAAGATVAKHGNRSVSSRTGAADLFELAGVNIELDAAQVGQCISEAGLGFMFAQRHHSAMKHAAGPRREMGVRTVFNVLGPLTNPAFAKRQVVGVFSADLVEPIAEALGELGSTHAMVVHALEGMDEISVSGDTAVAEYKDGKVVSYTLSPGDIGLGVHVLASVQVADTAASLAAIQAVFAGEAGGPRDMVLANAGAGLYVGGLADSHSAGVERAAAAVDSGAAAAKLSELSAVTRRLAGAAP
ncbi:MAG: anthranilate phosphoribosyltransferase [Pseudomonadota bacterium]